MDADKQQDIMRILLEIREISHGIVMSSNQLEDVRAAGNIYSKACAISDLITEVGSKD